MEVIPIELTEQQRRGLGGILHMVLKEIRVLGEKGDAERSADLADAFCQLPLRMHQRQFPWESIIRSAQVYEETYPAGKTPYVRILCHIRDHPNDC